MKSLIASLVIIALISLTPGCSQSSMQAYFGQRLPDEKVALLVILPNTYLELSSVDKKPLEEYPNKESFLFGIYYEEDHHKPKCQLLPGKHTLEFICHSGTFGVEDSLSVEAEFESGKIYVVERWIRKSYPYGWVDKKFLSANPHFLRRWSVVRIFRQDLPEKEWIVESKRS